MHRLLQRQLRKAFPGRELVRGGELAPDVEPEVAAFVRMVDAAYVAEDEDRAQFERSLNLASEELSERNQRLENELAERKRLEIELRMGDKLEAIGRLASGIAHEINTPVQYVADSIHFLRDATEDLMTAVEQLRAVRRLVSDGAPAVELVAQAALAAEAEDAADLPYLVENVPKAFERSLEGLARVANIVRSMKEFAHPDQKEMTPADLNRAIQTSLTIATNEYKYVADVETELGELPPVLCHVGDLNQAVLNIVVNAAHSIADMVSGTDERGCIRVCTRRDGDDVVITIADTGAGIPEAVRARIFEPFFTTKEVGKGTGQGLAIARSVITEKHGGQLRFVTEMGRGTTFVIRLPINGRKATPAAAVA